MQRKKSNIFLLLSGLMIITFLQSCDNSISEMDRNKVIVGQYYEAINLRKLDMAEILIDDNYVKFNNEGKSTKLGPVVFREDLQAHIDNNTDFIFSVNDMIAEGNKVAVRWSWKSTNIKTGVSIPVVSQGISIFTLNDGKITRLDQAFDVLGFNKQLGLRLAPAIEDEVE